MKILIASQNYTPYVGGIETHARQIAHEMSRAHEVKIVAVNFAPCQLPPRLRALHGSLLAPSCSDYQDGPIPVYALTPRGMDRAVMLPIATRCLPGLSRIGYHRLHRFGYRWYRAAYLPRLKGLMRNVDIVHSLAGGYLGWAVQEAARQRGIPFLSTPFVHPHQWGDGPDDIAYYRRAQGVIGLSSTDRDYLLSLGLDSNKTHEIGVSPEMPALSDGAGFRQRHSLGSAPLVLYVGRMMPQKGATGVLAAAPYVWKHIPETRFLFIGPGSIESSNWFTVTDERIRYLGKVSLQEKADAMAACDVFCMPSLSEILPTVYLEAWSLGKPVVGGMAHGLPELIEGHGAGVAVNQDPDRIASALMRLLSDAAMRECMGERGRELVRTEYSVPSVTGKLLSLYQNVIDQIA